MMERDPYREVGMDVPPLTDAQVDLPPQDDGMILSRAHYDALLARGDALAAAVEREHGLRHVPYPFEACATQVCDAARAWQAARA